MNIPSFESAKERKAQARELIVGAPVAALIWLLLIRAFSGSWLIGFPLVILTVSAVWSLLMLFREPVGTWACLAWRRLIFLIDWCVTRVVCLVLFLLVFTPIGLIMRIFGRRPLKLYPESNLKSYWISHTLTARDKKSYLKQF